MRIRMTVCMSGASFVRDADTVHDLPLAEAAPLLAAGFAIAEPDTAGQLPAEPHPEARIAAPLNPENPVQVLPPLPAIAADAPLEVAAASTGPRCPENNSPAKPRRRGKQ